MMAATGGNTDVVTGISREQYREAVQSGDEIIWQCLFCNDEVVPNAKRVQDRLEHYFDIPASPLDDLT